MPAPSSYPLDYLFIMSHEVAKGVNISRAEVYAGLSRFMDIACGIESDLPSGLDIHPVH